MACYCSTPDSDDQVEIERRCKVRMYFDVQEVMTVQQIDKSIEMKISKFPLDNENTRLCQLCSILDKETMEKVSAWCYDIKWEYETLYDWYIQHCKDDNLNN
jgi:hypothetical protein